MRSRLSARIIDWLGRQAAGEHMRLLLKRASAVFVTQVAGAGVMFVYGILLARWLKPEAYGLYSFATTLVLVLRILANSGLPMMLTRSVAVYGEAENWAHLKGLLHYAQRLSVGSGALTAVATGAAVVIFMPHPFGRAGSLILLALPLLCVMPVSDIAAGALRGLHQVAAGQALAALRSALYLVFLLCGFWISGQMTAGAAIILRIAAEAVGAALALIWLKRHLPSGLKTVAAAFEVKSWRQGQLGFMAIEAMYLIYLQIDILILGFMRPMADVGVYRMAANLSFILTFAASLANSSLGPLAASTWATGRKAELADAARRMSRISFLLTLSIYIAVLIALPLFIGILGKDYSSLGVPLVVLGLGQVIVSLMSSAPALVLMTHGERNGAWSVGASAACNLVLNLALIPLFGMAGSAIATAVSTVLQALFYTWFAYRRTGVSGAAIDDARLMRWLYKARAAVNGRAK